MSIPVTKTDLERRISAGEVSKFTRGDDNIVNSAIAQAWSKFRSEALNVWTPASVDALTAGTLPGEALYHIVSDACDVLSAGFARREEIEKKADEARLWRIRVARDQVRCFDEVLARITGAEDRDGVSYQTPARKLGSPWDYTG